jgi:hypothetical protein
LDWNVRFKVVEYIPELIAAMPGIIDKSPSELRKLIEGMLLRLKDASTKVAKKAEETIIILL